MYMQPSLDPVIPHYPPGLPRTQFCSPYSNNGGTIAAIAGDGFVIIGADTRLSSDFLILSRNQNKLFQLTNFTVLGSTGCWCDILTLNRILHAQMFKYEQEHHKPMSTQAAAQMLSTLLYYKRFFPYYISNILVGLDSDGRGCIYNYDPIGHHERSPFYATGTAGFLIQPLFDNQLGFKNMLNVKSKTITLERALSVMEDAFIFAAERDIYTGDTAIINIITKEDGVTENTFDLRSD